MKTAISSQSDSEDARLDPHFGKCSHFFIYNDESGTTEIIDNPGKGQKGCVGNLIIDILFKKNVRRVIAGDFGTNVQKFLNEKHIQMIIHPEKQIQVRDIILLLTNKNK